MQRPNVDPTPKRSAQRELVVASLLLCPDATYSAKERKAA
jgi:hypothetical protein